MISFPALYKSSQNAELFNVKVRIHYSIESMMSFPALYILLQNAKLFNLKVYLQIELQVFPIKA